MTARASGRPRLRAWALGIAVAASAALAGRSVLAGAYGSGPFSFPHQPHLSPATVAAALAEAQSLDRTGRSPGGGGTADRECRVCHDFERGNETHLTGCDTCHVDAKHLAAQVAPGAASSFPHREHLKDPKVTCFSCHAVQKQMGWVEFTIPEGGLGAAGVNGRPGGKHGELTCTDCHRTHEPAGGVTKKDDVTGDGKPCAACHAGATAILPKKHRAAPATGGTGTFRHADHGGADGDCEKCHAPVKASRTIWDYDPTVGTKAACETCHVDGAGRPLVGVASPARTTTLPTVRFDRFPHDAHLAPPKGETQVSGKVTDGCRTCHYPERDAEASKLFPARAASPEPVGRSALVDYDSCVPCHQTWKVEGHGVGAWACFKCHDGAASADGKLALARANVTRAGLAGGVQFAQHHHPGVTTGGAPLADASQPGGKQCRDCHVADPATLPSRLLGRTFRHEPHVGDAPTNADCLACHTTSATASWSRDLTRFDPHLDAPVTASDAAGAAKGCLVCHVGATREQLNATASPRIVPEFDHKGHVTGAKWKGAAGVPCAECHERGGDAGYTTPRDVVDCTRCHSHDETQREKFARTGVKTSTPEAAKACVHCHADLTAPVAPVAPPVRTHLSLLPGRQRHDKGGDCASCHGRDGKPYAYQERIRSAKVALSIHEDPALRSEWFNDPRIAKAGADPQGRTCMSCHRFEPRGYLRALGSR